MNMKDFTIYDLPLWLNAGLEELDSKCTEQLKEDSDFYNEILEESSKILRQYPFLSALIDREVIQKPMELSMEETVALSRFLALENDRRDMENIEMYLLGCRHTLEALQLLKMI